MSSEMQQLTPFDSFGDTDHGSALARPEQPNSGMAGKIHRSLRGRYWFIIPLSFIGGLIGAYFGFKSQKPLWKSDGGFQVAYYIPSPIPGGYNPAGEEIRQYDQWMLTQVAIMSSHTVIDRALQDKAWRSTGRGTGPAAYQQFLSGLVIEHPTGTQMINVTATDPDPGVAASEVRAIITAYEGFYRDRQNMTVTGDLQKMHTAAQKLAESIEADRDDIRSICRDISGSSNFEVFYNLKVNEAVTLEQKWQDAAMAVALSEKEGANDDLIGQLTNNQIGMLDPRMSTMVQQREIMDHDLEQSLFRLGDKNPLIAQKRAEILAQDQKMNSYAEEFRDLQKKMSAGQMPGAAPQQGGFQLIRRSHQSLVQQESALHDLLIKAQGEMRELGNKKMQVEKLQEHVDAQTKQLNDLNHEIDIYAMSNQGVGRLSVVSYGEVPVAPYKDRRKFMAGMVGMTGGMAPILFVICLGLFDRRYRYSDEAEGKAGQPPLLGILPTLPDHLADPEQAAVAAHCIHQIRIMLQVGSPMSPQQEPKRVFMVTSSNTGDGKTSLTMALGLSFAASGSRTLVMDCDMVGQGLTHRLKASQSPGLHEALINGSLHGRVKKTTTTNLYVLPIGGCDAGHAGSLSIPGMKKLLIEAKKVFDIVVIDTGPILGSLEANVVGAAADAVILAVSRGQNQPMVERAVKHLRSVGANIAGLVFNRAEKRDFNRSVGSASIRSVSVQPTAPKMLISEGDESSRFGPLARSVASFIPGNTTSAPAELGNGNGSGNGNGNGSHAADAPAEGRSLVKNGKKQRVTN